MIIDDNDICPMASPMAYAPGGIDRQDPTQGPVDSGQAQGTQSAATIGAVGVHGG